MPNLIRQCSGEAVQLLTDPLPWRPLVMLATFVIFLREGVEASMIIAILLAYLNRIGKREHFRDVFIGVGAALVLATAGGTAAYETVRSYDGSRAQVIFETGTYLLAATVLTYMT